MPSAPASADPANKCLIGMRRVYVSTPRPRRTKLVSALNSQSARSVHPSSTSATSIYGSGPPRSRAAWRRVATNRSSASMVFEARATVTKRAAPCGCSAIQPVLVCGDSSTCQCILVQPGYSGEPR
jgi:hypothetical protein